MRYQENRSVETVISWLKEQGAVISRRSYHVFFTRVLHRMPLAQAQFLGVNDTLLRAIRVRLKLAVDPRGDRVLVASKSIRHNCRQRRRPIQVGPKPKPAAKPKAVQPPVPLRPAKRQRHDAAQFPLPGMVGLPAAVKEPRKLLGTLEKPGGYGDWKIINEMARDKLFELDPRVTTNWDGMCINLKTRKEYSEEELVALFNLTPTEAQSCFITFNEPAARAGRTRSG